MFFIALNESDGAVFHFACAHCLSVHVIQLFYLEGRLLCDGHRLPLAQQVQRFSIFEQMGKLLALTFIPVDYLLNF